MSEGLITVIINAIAVLAGSFGSIKFITYRIEKLEQKVEKHNNVIHRTYILEESTNQIEKRLDRIESRLE